MIFRDSKETLIALLIGAFTIIIGSTWSRTIQRLFDIYIKRPENGVNNLIIYSLIITIIGSAFIWFLSRI